MRRARSLAALSLAALAAGGCAPMWRGTAGAPGLAPSGLPWGEEVTRRALVMGSFEQALARTQPRGGGAPDDPLLAALFRGQVAYYAGRYEESARAFVEAERLTDQRETKSVSRGVASLLVNDHALRYVPTRTERLFARYYAVLGRLESGDLAGATVEARRLSALLEASAQELDPAERATHAMLRDVAATVFEAAGEWNDAGVALRNAALLRGVSRADVDTIVASPPSGDSAVLVLVLERGFAAHYVERTLALPLDDGPVTASSRRRERRSAGPSAASSAAWLAALDALPDGGVFLSERTSDAEAGAPPIARPASVATDWTPRGAGPTRVLGAPRVAGRWLELAWPMLVRSRLPEAPLALSVVEGPARSLRVADLVAPPGRGAEVSDALGADARRARGARLARLTARAATRIVAVEAVREEHGEAAGLLAGLVASSLERADTRAWHLLPGHVAVMRVTVPAGQVVPALRQGAGSNAVPLPLPAFDAVPGSVHVRAVRVWRDPASGPTLADGHP